MNELTIRLLLAASVLGALTGCQRSGETRESETSSGANPPPAEVQRSPEGVKVTVQAKAQERLGIGVEQPKAMVTEAEVKAYGRVLDPAPLVNAVTDMQAAHNTLAASKQELDRVRMLFQQDRNASARAMETAESNFRRDEIAVQSLQLKLIAAWGKSLVEQADLPGLVHALAARDCLLVRLDLPAGQFLKEALGAKLTTLEAPEDRIEATLLGGAPDVDSQTQGQGFLLLVKRPTAALRPGQAVTGYLQTAGAGISGVLVPASAIVRADGKAWVFVQTDALTFVRREIKLDRPADGGWLVREGVAARDKLVVTGAQMLYSEELKSGIPIGD
jgi:hypothetical protein